MPISISISISISIAKYQLLINKCESVELMFYDNTKAFIECSNDMDYIYENIDNSSPYKKRIKC